METMQPVGSWNDGDRISDVLQVENNIRTGKVHSWELLQEMRYTTAYLMTGPEDRAATDSKPPQVLFAVPTNSVTDFASIPRPLWWIAAPWGRHGRAGILHDYAYRRGQVQLITGDGQRESMAIARNEADYLFFSAMFVLDREYNSIGNEGKGGGAISSIVRVTLRTLYPLVRLFMVTAVVCFGWQAYKGKTKNSTTAAAVVASIVAAVGTGLLLWWLAGRLLESVVDLGPVGMVGYLGLAALGSALVLTRVVVELAERTLRARIHRHFADRTV